MRKTVTFTQRQVAWKKYDTLYRDMIREPLKEMKRMKRKKVDKYRDEIKQVPTSLISTIVLSILV